MTQKPVRKTIAVDIDDVLAANAEGFVKFSNERWGTNLKPDDYSEHWAQMWQTDYEEEKRRRDEIVASKIFVTHKFFEEAKPALEVLKKRYKLVIVSSRGTSIRQDTVKWIEEGFKGIFEEIHFAPIWDDLEKHTLEKLKYTKADILRQVGADYLVDDQPKHCIAAAQAGIKSVLFGDYRWNRDIELLENMYRAKNWHEVLDFFNEQNR